MVDTGHADRHQPAAQETIVLADLAKVELHLHLDLSVSYGVARRLVPELSRAEYRRRLQGPDRCSDLSAFLAATESQVALLQTRRALALLTTDVIHTLAAENVVYAELRFAPLLHCRDGLRPNEAVDAVLRAAEDASRAAGVRIGVILTTLRHFDRHESLETARLALAHRHDGVVGFDLGGDETGFALAPHLPAFDLVRSEGLAYTVHAGEAGGPESVRQVLDTLAPRRIGHGVRSIEDAALVDRLAEEDVHLEVCPSCNVQLGVVPSLDRHPLDALRRAGVRVGISTDSRAATVTDLTREHALVSETFGWGLEDLRAVNHDALHAAFLSATDRDRVADASG